MFGKVPKEHVAKEGLKKLTYVTADQGCSTLYTTDRRG
jgi:hypothetical protein